MPKHRKPGPAAVELGQIIRTPEVRRWLYRVALAVIALCVGYGLLTDHAGALWGALAAAVVSLPVASANVPQTGD